MDRYRHRPSKSEQAKELRAKLGLINEQIKLLEKAKTQTIAELRELEKVYGLSTPVAKIDIITGEVLNTYYSMKYAQQETGVDRNKICQVCRNQRKTAGGFKWEYLE